MRKRVIIPLVFGFLVFNAEAQKLLPFKLSDTGQTTSYTVTPGEDADFAINPLSFTDNGDGTITDNNTGLMWQKTDGGEMTADVASTYCKNLNLGAYSDWRLPTGIELFSINQFGSLNPAMNISYFPQTGADYWWTSEIRADDASKVWAVNAGGGIGAHPKTETTSAGGFKSFHVRAVRDLYSTTFSVPHFTDNGDGTVTDHFTGLIWQQIHAPNPMTWEEALQYCQNQTLGGKTDWRLPNIKELQSLNDPTTVKPSFDKQYFPTTISGNYWSSTTLHLTDSKAWDINVDYGIVSQNDKTIKEYVLLVRGGMDNTDLNISEAQIPGGEFDMGDHFGFVDPGHPSDELPTHRVKVDSFVMAKTETTNQQFLAFLNAAWLKGEIEVKNNTVYLAGTSNIVCYTNQLAPYYNISFDGKVFSMANFRGNHPMVGVRWEGAAAFCNWLSLQNELDKCYDLTNWTCDFTKNGYRLPTEAEWEYAARGGMLDPYLNYPTSNNLDVKSANLPGSGDPYESTNTNLYPFTTPVGFYDGKLHLKSEYNWPGSDASYQTDDGVNGFGLYDMQGNVWEFVNDWYSQNYYSSSPFDNPKGPDSGSLMPDGKPYRGMRGGNWYNGLNIGGISDGHSRVSNRNPSYYRGPQDPNHPYYHLGFRVVRKVSDKTTSSKAIGNIDQNGILLKQNFPNPLIQSTTIPFVLAESKHVTLKIYDSMGQLIATLADEKLEQGSHNYHWDAGRNIHNGIYICKLQTESQTATKTMVVAK